ncbi:MAG: shikimate kinase [Blautia sp.]|nr:shikimate kinase [Blautia sp.]MDY4000126.1 shikimate kinase [Blautia sp.]
MNEKKELKKNWNLFLIGFMGCGKSTVSDCFSREYGMEKVEMDEQIERNEGKTIAEIFAGDGEEHFRFLETELLRQFRSKQNTVVSCGGGTAMRECNVREMKKHGKIVLLKAEPQTVYERVRNFHNRPLLEGNMNVEYIASLMEKRAPRYEAAADIVISTDGKTVSEICSEIVSKF